MDASASSVFLLSLSSNPCSALPQNGLSKFRGAIHSRKCGCGSKVIDRFNTTSDYRGFFHALAPLWAIALRLYQLLTCCLCLFVVFTLCSLSEIRVKSVSAYLEFSKLSTYLVIYVRLRTLFLAEFVSAVFLLSKSM
jgi:hypothetical protein